MPGGAVAQLKSMTADVSRVEAPVTVKAYLMCAFAAFGGIFFGYDTGWISGVMGMPFFINLYTGLPYPPATLAADFQLAAWEKSLNYLNSVGWYLFWCSACW